VGLDRVEFMLAVEDAFQVALPSDATLPTPGSVIDYLDRRLADKPTVGTSAIQRAFYLLRKALVEHHGHVRQALAPSTQLVELWPVRTRKQAWLMLQKQVSATRWPPTPSTGFFARHVFAQPHTLGELAEYVAAYSPHTLFRHDERWTRAQIEEIVRQLVEHQFSISRSGYTLESRFLQDLHVD